MLFGLLYIPLNLITIPFKLALNSIRLVTEVLPSAVTGFLNTLSAELIVHNFFGILSIFFDTEKTKRQKIIPLIKHISALVLGLIAGVAYLISASIAEIGSHITSPVYQVRKSWSLGKKLGVGAALFYSGYSILQTLCIYAILFPLAIKLLSTTVIPYIASHLPALIINSMQWIAQAFSPVLTVLGNLIAILVNLVFPYVLGGLGIAAMPALIGLGGLFGATISIAGSPIQRLSNVLTEKWHFSSKETPESLPSEDRVEQEGSSYGRLHELDSGKTLKNSFSTELPVEPAAAAPGLSIFDNSSSDVGRILPPDGTSLAFQ
jgi:hypothetical protein